MHLQLRGKIAGSLSAGDVDVSQAAEEKSTGEALRIY